MGIMTVVNEINKAKVDIYKYNICFDATSNLKFCTIFYFSFETAAEYCLKKKTKI